MNENLKPWDGKCGEYSYNPDDAKSWGMQIDEAGNIWYLTRENPPKLSMWCSSNNLRRHLFYLEQMEARRPIYNV